MSKSKYKYFYKGMTLVDYCKENNIDYDVINSRICSLRKKENYKDKSDEELIELALTKKFNSRRYYKGLSLRKYCENNGLDYTVINTRLGNLKKDKKYKDNTLDELIEIAINAQTSLKYFYKGMTLSKYCKQHNLRRDTIIARVNVLKNSEEYKDKSDEELIEMAIASHGNTKYMYKGMSLPKYCIKMGIDYRAVVKKIKKKQMEKQYAKYTMEELIEESLSKETKAAYFYKGETLYDYCKNNGLKYATYISRILKAKRKEENKGLSDQEIVNLIMKNELGIKYFYKGKTLAQYCKENKLRYDTIQSRVHKIRTDNRYKDLSMDKIIEMAINKEYKPIRKAIIRKVKYSYNGIPLKKYCDENKISYKKIRLRIHHYNHDENYKDLTDNEIVKLAIEGYVDKRIKYGYKGKSLIQYCKDNDLGWYGIKARLDAYKEKEEYKNLTQEELIDIVIEDYKTSIKNNKKLSQIRNNKFRYNISYENLKEVLKELPLEKSINVIYYFGDKQDSLGNKMITSERLKEIKDYASEINNKSYDELDLYYLIGLYKTGLMDTREIILNKEDSYLNKIMFKICDKSDVDIDDYNKDDFISEIRANFLVALDIIDTNNERELITNIDNYIKDNFKKYVDSYVDNSKNISFDENKHSIIKW